VHLPRPKRKQRYSQSVPMLAARIPRETKAQNCELPGNLKRPESEEIFGKCEFDKRLEDSQSNRVYAPSTNLTPIKPVGWKGRCQRGF
jgi:hypothetical protein